jgi:hypothetical protein
VTRVRPGAAVRGRAATHRRRTSAHQRAPPPQVYGEAEVKAQIKLLMHTSSNAPVIVSRSFQVCGAGGVLVARAGGEGAGHQASRCTCAVQ